MTPPWPDLTGLTLGPVALAGHHVRLRPPRLDDFGEWRRIRLRDRESLRPFMISSPLDWDARHSGAAWTREWLTARADARRGRRLATVIEIDGRFAGQCELGSLDVRAESAELGIWIDRDHAGSGLGGLAAALLLDFATGPLGLRRVTAPIAADNIVTRTGAAAMGMRREALLVRAVDAGGRRTDHELWALTRADVPAGGFVARWLRAEHGTARPGPGRTTGALTSVRVSERAAPPMSTVVALASRHAAASTARAIRARLPTRRITLAVPGFPDVVLRGTRFHDPRTPDGLTLAIRRGAETLGHARLFGLDMFDRNISAALAPPSLGGDLRAAVLSAVVARCRLLGIERVTMLTDPADELAATVLSANGFHKEGVLREVADGDRELWAATLGVRP